MPGEEGLPVGSQTALSSKRSASTDGRGFNINDFRSFRDNAGMIKTHDYHVVIPWPAGLLRGEGELAAHRDIEMACESVNWPATGAVTYNVQRYSYGAIETRPVIPKFSPIQCVFMCDRKTQLWQFFHDWVQISCNYDFGNSIVSPSLQYSDGGQSVPYEVGYKHEYAVDFYIYVYDQHGTLVRKTYFREAYPIDVGDVPLAWGRQNDYVKIPVVFTFIDWHEELVAGK